MSKLSIIQYATQILDMHLFDYEIKKLLDFENYLQSTEFMEFVRPSKRENQRTYDIWLSYQEYIGKPVRMITVPAYT
jgi:hypothetical protein